MTWEETKPPKRKELKNDVSYKIPRELSAISDVSTQFIDRIASSGVFSLPFFHSPAAPRVHKFERDWPANEMLKQVLTDQRCVLD
jgi:hypothetical protein